MKIGIVTFVKADNYGAELQAYALQKYLNNQGYDAEVLDIEKEVGVLESSTATYLTAIINRFKYYGLVRGILSVINLVYFKLISKVANIRHKNQVKFKKDVFNNFFSTYIKHSPCQYTLDKLRKVNDLPYDILIAGSDQIWNFMQTNYLDVFFLNICQTSEIRRIAYAPSFGVSKLPSDKVDMYREYIKKLDAISVREYDGIEIVRQCLSKNAKLVLDPTLLLNREEWVSFIGKRDYLPAGEKYVVIYTLSGSRYIYQLAKMIASKLGANVINIKSGFSRWKGEDGIVDITDAGPCEFISIYDRAVYVITDSFHGTAFAVNFNIPFTTLLNPVSTINSRALSFLKLTGTEDRLIYDDGSNLIPDSLEVDFEMVNARIDHLRKESHNYLIDSIS